MMRCPQVYLSNVDASKSSCSTPREVVVVKEAWSPFVLGSDIASSERVRAGRNADVTLDSFIISSSILVSVFMYFLPMVGFSILLRWLVEMASDTDFKIISLKSLWKMLVLQYLVNVLEGDFLPHNSIYKGWPSWRSYEEWVSPTYCQQGRAPFFQK